jgi:hypothetical protein
MDQRSVTGRQQLPPGRDRLAKNLPQKRHGPATEQSRFKHVSFFQSKGASNANFLGIATGFLDPHRLHRCPRAPGTTADRDRCDAAAAADHDLCHTGATWLDRRAALIG